MKAFFINVLLKSVELIASIITRAQLFTQYCSKKFVSLKSKCLQIHFDLTKKSKGIADEPNIDADLLKKWHNLVGSENDIENPIVIEAIKSCRPINAVSERAVDVFLLKTFIQKNPEYPNSTLVLKQINDIIAKSNDVSLAFETRVRTK